MSDSIVTINLNPKNRAAHFDRRFTGHIEDLGYDLGNASYRSNSSSSSNLINPSSIPEFISQLSSELTRPPKFVPQPRGVSVSWESVCYSVKTSRLPWKRRNRVSILQGVTGISFYFFSTTSALNEISDPVIVKSWLLYANQIPKVLFFSLQSN